MAFNIGLTVTANNTSGRAFDRLNKNLNKTERNAKKTSKALKGLRLAIGLIAVGALVSFAKNLTETTGKLQLMLIRLGNVEGGAKKAKVTFDRLFKTFGSSPFTIDAVTDSLIRLRAAGVESGLAERAVTAGADAIAAFGGTSEELKRFSIGLQQVAGKGVLSMEELRQQIGEALPVAMATFATESGRSISEVISDVKKGKISAAEFIELLTTGLEKRFGGFSKKLGDTVLGSIQGGKSRIQKAIADVFLGNTDVAVRLAMIIQNATFEVEKFIQGLNQQDVDNFFDAMRRGANILVGVGEVLIFVSKIFVGFLDSMTNSASSGGLEVAGGMGLVGLLMFGPLGAVAGVVAGLSLAGAEFDRFKKKVANPTDPGEDTIFNRMLNGSMLADGSYQEQFDKAKKIYNDFQKNVTNKKGGEGGETLGDQIFGFDRFRALEIQDNLDDVAEGAGKAARAIQGYGETSQKAQEQLEGLLKRTSASLSGAETFPFVKTAETSLNRLEKIIEGFEGDRKLKKKLEGLSKPTGAQSDQLAALGREFAKTAKDIARAKEEIAKTRGIGFAKELIKANVTTERVIAGFKELVGGVSDLEAAHQKVNKEFAKHEADLKKSLQEQIALTKAGEFETQGAKNLREQLARVNEERQKAHDFAARQVLLAQKQLEIETRISGLNAEDTIKNLEKETRGAFGTILGSDSTDQADLRRNELKRQGLEIENQLIELRGRRDIAHKKENFATESSLNKQIEALGRVKAAQIEALQQTTAMGLAAREMWMSVRDAMTGAAEQGLLALVRGTQSFKDIATNAFNSLQEAAARFLIELIKIRVQKAIIAAMDGNGGGGGSSGNSGGSFFGLAATAAAAFFGGSAKGNAFKGKVTPFANGGIIGGPTLFGLAGEAGEEAIMPLTRVGGKLGVQTTGGAGGDTFAITVQAIDTQSGAEFVRKNASTIINTMRQANGLNRGIGNVR